MKTYLLAAGLFFIAGIGYSQTKEPQDNVLSLQEAIEIAVKNNIQVQQAGLDVEANSISYNQSKLGRYPTLNGQASHSYAFGRSIDPFTNSFTNDPIRSNNFGLFAEVTLFNGLARNNQIKQNLKAVEASQKGMEATENDVMLSVTNAYLQVLLNRELLEVARLQLATSEAQLGRTKRLVEAGALAMANQLELEAQVATDKLQVVNAENNLALSKVSLLQALQLPANQTFEVEEVPVDITEVALVQMNPEAIYEEALTNQPVITSAELQEESAEYGVAAAKGSLYPRLSLSGNIFTQYSSIGTESDAFVSDVFFVSGYFQSNPNEAVEFPIPQRDFVVTEIPFWDQLDFNRRENLALNLNIPIFNGYQARASVGQAKVQQRRAELALENAKIQLRTNIEQAYANARAAAARYRALEEQVRSLDLSFKNVEKRYELKAANVVEYNIAKNNLDRARADLAQAKYNYIFATKVIDFYLGKTISF